MKLGREFYLRDDVLVIARELLGKVLVSALGDVIRSGVIIEAEAYAGISDRASHAWGGRRTNRTEVMYGIGGLAYIYLCYGVHSLFNVVTNGEGIPHAVLIRGIRPLDGLPAMRAGLGNKGRPSEIIQGPGKLTNAMGIHYSQSGLDLTGDKIWIEERKSDLRNYKLEITPRIGVAYAGEDALLPYRFVLVKNKN
ncbi:MAG: DNA-3-methyladenine glycosylase [Bacteroidales bacterium]|nr:DNA-3-methyladenine glycosylase [Bacteroidales bacterium]MDZ4203737.1 DNA-3-methyladenine glycosylase [Bacteroidales bacterium]